MVAVRVVLGSVRVPLLLFVVDDLASLQIVLLVLVHLTLAVEHVVAGFCRVHRLLRTSFQVLLPDQDLVSCLDLDLLVFEREGDPALVTLVLL